jgi:hypothetical protein
MTAVWDGITQPSALGSEAIQARMALADAAKAQNWSVVFEILDTFSDWINACRPGGNSQFAPLHQVAYSGAPDEVAKRLIRLGAFRTIQNARGERPLDVAERMGHSHLLQVLKPRLKQAVPLGILLKIQSHFHSVIRGRIDSELPNHGLRMPELEPLLELTDPQIWFPVPGMYGGFNFRLVSTGVQAKLEVESWCRVVGGSGQRHEITPEGSALVEEGFV